MDLEGKQYGFNWKTLPGWILIYFFWSAAAHWGYHRQGSCQAGLGASITPVIIIIIKYRCKKRKWRSRGVDWTIIGAARLRPFRLDSHPSLHQSWGWCAGRKEQWTKTHLQWGKRTRTGKESLQSSQNIWWMDSLFSWHCLPCRRPCRRILISSCNIVISFS